MIISTKAILINYFKFKENFLITEFFTYERGKESFIVSLKNFPRNFFKILSSYDLEIIVRNTREIQKIKNIFLINNYDFYFNNTKSCIIIFISEFLNKILPKNQADHNIFNFIENSIKEFNNLYEGIANFHLSFILKLTKYLGISIESYLINSKIYIDEYSGNTSNLNYDIILNLYKLEYAQLHNIKLNKLQRNNILETILSFYSNNYGTITKLKSIDILKEIFD